MNETLPYTRMAVALHWLIAGLMITNVSLGLTAELFSDRWIRPVVDTHKSIGITVLGLALLRLLWRATHRPPALPLAYRLWERRMSTVVHGLLYFLMLALPVSGWLHDSAWKDAATHPMYLFGLVPWPRIVWIGRLDPALKERLHGLFGQWHEGLGFLLYVLFALHLGGALKHQFIDKHAELRRMSW